MKIGSRVSRLIGKSGLEAACAVIVSLVMSAIVLLTVVDVVGRYWFNSSIEGGFEITELLLVLLIFSALPLVSKKDAHIVVDLINPMLGKHLKKVSDVFSQVFSGVVLFAMAWFLWDHAGRLKEYNDVTAILHVHIYPFVYFISVLSAIASLIHLYNAFFVPKDDKPPAAEE